PHSARRKPFPLCDSNAIWSGWHRWSAALAPAISMEYAAQERTPARSPLGVDPMSLPQMVRLLDHFNSLPLARVFRSEDHVLAVWNASMGLKDLLWRGIVEPDPAERVDHRPRGGRPDSKSSETPSITRESLPL